MQFCLDQSEIQSRTQLPEMIVKSFFSYFSFKSSWMISLVCQYNLPAKEAFVHELAQPLPWLEKRLGLSLFWGFPREFWHITDLIT